MKLSAWLFGEPNVEKLQAKGNIKGLIAALRYLQEDKTKLNGRVVRLKAIWALHKLKTASAIEPLITILQAGEKDADYVRAAAAWALGQSGGKQAVEALVCALQEHSWIVRVAAAAALGQTEHPTAVDPLKHALRDEIIGVRAAALWALAKVERMPDESQYIAQIASFRETMFQDLWALVSREGDENTYGTYLSRAAAITLGRMGETQVVEFLRHSLHSDAGKKRQREIDAVLQHLIPAYQPTIQNIISAHPDWNKPSDHSSMDIVAQLAQLEYEQAIDFLVLALQSKNLDARQYAAWSLSEIKVDDSRVTEAIIHAITDRDDMAGRTHEKELSTQHIK